MFYMQGQRCIRPDLIAKELDEGRLGVKFHPQTLSRRFISWLFRHYDIVEYVTHFYDDEPHDIDEMLGFPGEDVHWWDSAAGRAAAYPIFRAYEEYRMTFCNWVDVINPGGWVDTQAEANKLSRVAMEGIRNWPVPKKGRVFAAERDNGTFYLYAYGRDFLGEDLWFMAKRRKTHGE